jgi:hypothetical protein
MIITTATNIRRKANRKLFRLPIYVGEEDPTAVVFMWPKN